MYVLPVLDGSATRIKWRIFSVQHYIYARLIDLSAEALIDVQVCVAFMGADGI